MYKVHASELCMALVKEKPLRNCPVTTFVTGQPSLDTCLINIVQLHNKQVYNEPNRNENFVIHMTSPL